MAEILRANKQKPQREAEVTIKMKQRLQSMKMELNFEKKEDIPLIKKKKSVFILILNPNTFSNGYFKILPRYMS